MFVGTDIVEVARIQAAIERGGISFLQRVFTEKELEQINISDPDYERASGFWAAKESIVKAVGSGFRQGIVFHDIEIDHDEFGCPFYVFYGSLLAKIKTINATKISLSISHCRTHAIAVSILC